MKLVSLRQIDYRLVCMDVISITIINEARVRIRGLVGRSIEASVSIILPDLIDVNRTCSRAACRQMRSRYCSKVIIVLGCRRVAFSIGNLRDIGQV